MMPRPFVDTLRLRKDRNRRVVECIRNRTKTKTGYPILPLESVRDGYRFLMSVVSA
jgi:hypothetical protein